MVSFHIYLEHTLCTGQNISAPVFQNNSLIKLKNINLLISFSLFVAVINTYLEMILMRRTLLLAAELHPSFIAECIF